MAERSVPFGNMKSATPNEDASLMKCASGTIRNALLHEFAKRIRFILAKPMLHVDEVDASPKKSKQTLALFLYPSPSILPNKSSVDRFTAVNNN